MEYYYEFAEHMLLSAGLGLVIGLDIWGICTLVKGIAGRIRKFREKRSGKLKNLKDNAE